MVLETKITINQSHNSYRYWQFATINPVSHKLATISTMWSKPISKLVLHRKKGIIF